MTVVFQELLELGICMHVLTNRKTVRVTKEYLRNFDQNLPLMNSFLIAVNVVLGLKCK